MQKKIVRAARRKTRIRAKIKGTEAMPRLSVHKTTKHIYAQLIDDSVAKTLVGVSEKELPEVKGTKSEKAKALGMLIAKKAEEKKIKKVVFDKGEFRYHGRVRAFAEGAREGGLKF